MQNRTLGKDLSVSAVGLGCMGFSHGYGLPTEAGETVKLLRRAVDLGYTFFDTAEVYGTQTDPHANETLVGQALAPVRDQVVLSTKFGLTFDFASGKTPLPIVPDSRPETIRRSVEGSLRRLGTDHIDLYFQHRIDPAVAPEEVAEGMADLIREGKITHWGISEANEDYLRRAHKVCPVTAVQNRYSMMARQYESLFPTLEELGIGFVAFSPMANGFLTGQYGKGAAFDPRYDYRSSMPQFTDQAVDQNQARVTTAAYQAERDLDRLMYQDTGLYRNQQYAKASTVLLQTMYEEIPILWDQEMKYRPSFSAAGDTVTLPVICQKICGVKDGNASQYWLDIKKLITPDTEVIRSVPWVQGTDPNPVKPYATQFLKNGKLLRGKIKSHSAYLYGILRAEMQEHLLDKLQLLLDQKLIRGTFENGTEYTVIATALNLPKDLLRKIQKFDFTKKNPKLIYINPTEERISLEDSILTAFLSLVGFDVLFFVPTGYQCIEQHFTRPFASETQIGDYLYDLRIPDFNTVQESGLHSIRKLFGRSI